MPRRANQRWRGRRYTIRPTVRVSIVSAGDCAGGGEWKPGLMSGRREGAAAPSSREGRIRRRTARQEKGLPNRAKTCRSDRTSRSVVRIECICVECQRRRQEWKSAKPGPLATVERNPTSPVSVLAPKNRVSVFAPVSRRSDVAPASPQNRVRAPHKRAGIPPTDGRGPRPIRREPALRRAGTPATGSLLPVLA